MQELRNIQALRALAALLVVWAHLKEFFPASPLLNALPSGIAGVDIFFVVSGFIMVVSTEGRRTSPASFLARRYLRIAPLYYIFTLLIFGLALALPAAFKSTAADLPSLLQSLAFIPYEKSGGRIYPVYYLGWTLNYEMFFYLLFAVALQLRYAARGLIVAGFVLVLVGIGLTVPFRQDLVPLFAFSRPIMLDFATGALIGVAAPLLADFGKRSPGGATLTLIVGAIALFGLVYVFPASAESQQTMPNTDTVIRYGLPAALIVASAVALEAAGRTVRNRFVLLIGDASYSLYLSHFLVVSVGILAAHRLGITSTPLLIGLALATFIACLAVAIGVYFVLERPLHGFARRLRVRPKSAALA